VGGREGLKIKSVGDWAIFVRIGAPFLLALLLLLVSLVLRASPLGDDGPLRFVKEDWYREGVMMRFLPMFGGFGSLLLWVMIRLAWTNVSKRVRVEDYQHFKDDLTSWATNPALYGRWVHPPIDDGNVIHLPCRHMVWRWARFGATRVRLHEGEALIIGPKTIMKPVMAFLASKDYEVIE
jgi:hypothetical protein